MKRNLITSAVAALVTFMSLGHLCACGAHAGASENNAHHGCMQSAASAASGAAYNSSCTCGDINHDIQLINNISDPVSQTVKIAPYEPFFISFQGNDPLLHADFHKPPGLNGRYYLLAKTLSRRDLCIVHSTFLI